eukprot:TRINITY_DN2650_c0_g1_i4.p1 TRINITY_DN2650_c0_g1~~TRINITY_DN2650_c0_g1_i4.p1  ORF type:complete len:406 (-),score=69.02 TRINITY_DN2650_c0_g1_i4:173-1390(-)
MEEYSAMTIVHDIAAGLQHMHKHNICHYDVKDTNIMVRASGRAFLIDLEHGNTGGDKPLYPSGAVTDEEAKKGHWGPWTDVYAFGLVVQQIERMFCHHLSEIEKTCLSFLYMVTQRQHRDISSTRGGRVSIDKAMEIIACAYTPDEPTASTPTTTSTGTRAGAGAGRDEVQQIIWPPPSPVVQDAIPRLDPWCPPIDCIPATSISDPAAVRIAFVNSDHLKGQEKAEAIRILFDADHLDALIILEVNTCSREFVTTAFTDRTMYREPLFSLDLKSKAQSEYMALIIRAGSMLMWQDSAIVTDPNRRWNRVPWIFKLSAGSSRIVVVAAHLKPHYSGKYTEEMFNTPLLVGCLDEMAKNNTRRLRDVVVLGGDLNLTPGSAQFKGLQSKGYIEVTVLQPAHRFILC